MGKRKKIYTEDFRKQAVELAKSLGNYSQAARQLGISDASLYDWARRLTDQKPAKVLSESEQEIERLKKENAEDSG